MEKIPLIFGFFVFIILLLIFGSGFLIGFFGIKSIVWILATLGVLFILKLIL